MAVIGSIRKRSGLLVGVVGAAMVLFIAGEALTSGSIFFSAQNNEIGSIDGSSYSAVDFELMVQTYLAKNYPDQSMINAQVKDQARDAVWRELIRQAALQTQFDALGISVSDNEVLDMIKNNPSNPILVRYFSDPQTRQIFDQFVDPQTGGLSSAAVINYLQTVVYGNSENPQAAQAKAGWEAFQEQDLKNSMLQKKFNDLVAGGMYRTNIEVEQISQETSAAYTFKAASKLYSAVPDDQVTYSDADLREYYNKHKNEVEYTEEKAVRSMDYVVWEVIPTEKDEAYAEAELQDMVTSFEASTADTLFVQENSDTPFNFKWVSEGSFPAVVDSTIMNAEMNTVIGPFKNGERYELVKVKDQKMAPDSIRSSHILLQIAEGQDSSAVMALADSLENEIANGANFAVLASEFSQDQGSATNGGDIDWMTENSSIVPEYKKAAFDLAEKDGVVRATSQFGEHIIKITDVTASKEKVYVAVVDNAVEASTETMTIAYNESSKFSRMSNNAEAFATEGATYGIRQEEFIGKADLNVGTLPNSKSIVTWLYNNEVGTVSTPFELEDMYVVALITSAREKGLQPFEIVKDDLIEPVIKEKKAEMLMAQVSDKVSVEEAAAQWGTNVQGGIQANFGNLDIPGLGVEPNVLGTMVAMQQGDLSNPIEGERGVYMIEMTAVQEGTASLDGKANSQMNLERRASFEPIRALNTDVEIEDNRYKFY